jgi:streptogramin lyase
MRRRGWRALPLVVTALVASMTGIGAGQADAVTGVVTQIRLPVPDVTPVGVTAGPSNSVWFAENAGDAVGRIDSAGKVTEFPLPLTAQKTVGGAQAIVQGPDHALWFTDVSVDVPRVGRIDPATGKLKMWAVPASLGLLGGEFTDLTVGPDGALWIAANAGGVLVRVTTAGVFKSYPTAGTAPYALTTGPDKALWFTDSATGMIGRLVPATGAVTTYPAPSATTATPDLGGITVGPDKALWFTEPGAGKIGRIDPATKAITEFPVNTAYSAPEGITTGPGGLLWFTEAAASNVASLDPASGTVTEYPLPTTLSAPMRIVNGPHGTLWFSEPGNGTIGHINPAAPPAGVPHAATSPYFPGTPEIGAAFQGQCTIGQLCQTQVTTSGSVKIGSFTQSLPANAIRLTGSIATLTPGSVLNPPVIGKEFTSAAVTVPGGLIGRLPLVGPILGKSPAAMLPFNKLTVTQSLVGKVTVGFGAAGLQAAAKLNIHLNNPLLGSSCVIGPLAVNLSPQTLDTTTIYDPQLGWEPIPVAINDSTVAVPAATGCGIGGILDGVINYTMGLPSKSGNNVITLRGILSLGVGLNPVGGTAARLPSSLLRQPQRALHLTFARH